MNIKINSYVVCDQNKHNHSSFKLICSFAPLCIS